MRIIISTILFWLVFELPAQMLEISGSSFFVNGINIPWRYFGKDFGGVGQERYDGGYFERTFIELEEHGVNAVRVWLHCDARFSPTFDRSGLVSGLPRHFIEDFLDFLDRAEQHHIMVIPVLWTFELADRQNRNAIIASEEVLQSYIDHALLPLLAATKERCNILAWEIMNEPEWMMDIPYGGTTNEVFSAEVVQRFIGRQADAIHQSTDHRVTVGSAGLRFLTNLHFRAHNYWHDTELQAQNLTCQGAYLDFYSVHYYKWALEPLSPFKQSCSELAIDKPVLIGEFGQHKRKNTLELLELAKQNGYAGTMPWSMNANDGVGRWTDYREDLQLFAQQNKHLMPEKGTCITTELNDGFISCLLYPNPARDHVVVHNPNSTEDQIVIELVSMLGNKIKTWSDQTESDMNLDIGDLPAGSYVVRIYSTEADGSLRQRSRQKLVIVRS